jgi:membrane-associated protease RseP (regulator of RpoE activity)
MNASTIKELVLPLILLAASAVTTTAIGARFMQNFLLGRPTIASDSDLWPWPWLLHDPSRFRLGCPFSAALLLILLTHEFGHYFACRAHGIRATLPWVLPAPTLSGTAGAVIRIQSRIPSRRALVDVGAWGPIAGYCASLVACIVGIGLSEPAHPVHSARLVDFGAPITLSALPRLLHAPAFEHTLRHPILIAGWVGLFITALNLIPAGQLDGGHLLYALSPRAHRWTTRIAPIALLLLGLFFWVGWALWGLMLLIPAMRRHPRVPTTIPLGPGRALLCLFSLVIFALTFSLAPFAQSSLLHYLR